MTVFVYEDVTATRAGGDEQSPPAQSLLAEGRAMLEAVTADFRSVGCPVLTVDPGRNIESQFHELAQSAGYTLLIAPECDGRLEHLAARVIDLGGKLLGPSPEAIRLTADKLALARHWEASGVTTPKTWLPSDAPVDRPGVIKPRDGAGSQRMQRCPASRPVRAAHESPESGGNVIWQEYVPGFAASVAFLVGPLTLTPLVPCAQYLSSDGRFQYQGGHLPIQPHLAERAIRIATMAVRCVPGLAGYVGVDVVLGIGDDSAIEINPRLTTSYVGLRALAKFNIAGAMFAAVRGESLPSLEWHSEAVVFTPDGRVSPFAA